MDLQNWFLQPQIQELNYSFSVLLHCFCFLKTVLSFTSSISLYCFGSNLLLLSIIIIWGCSYGLNRWWTYFSLPCRWILMVCFSQQAFSFFTKESKPPAHRARLYLRKVKSTFPFCFRNISERGISFNVLISIVPICLNSYV